MNIPIKKYSLFLIALLLSSFLISFFLDNNKKDILFEDKSKVFLQNENNISREECLRKLRLRDSIERVRANSIDHVAELTIDNEGNLSGDFSNLPKFQFFSSIGDCVFPLGTPALAVGDVNKDGYPDIVKAPNLLYLNRYGEKFELIELPLPKVFSEDEGRLSTIPVIESWPSTPVISDLDQDGTNEIFFTNRISVGGQEILVYSQSNGNWYLDKSYNFNFGELSHFPNAQTITVFDFNNDRLPDILLGFLGGQNFLYNKERGLTSPGLMLLLNKGDKNFVDITDSFNLNFKLNNILKDNLYVGSRTTFTDPIMFVNGFSTNDYNNDGFIDIFVAGDYGTGVLLYNIEGRDLIIDAKNKFFGHSLMGPASSDINDDGVLDIYASQIYQKISTPFVCAGGRLGCDSKLGNNLWVSDGLGGWEDRSIELGVREGGWGWGSAFVDFDNDGEAEIVQMNGQVLELSPAEIGWTHRRDPMTLFHRNDKGKYHDIAFESGLYLPFSTSGLGIIDINLDGLVDIVVASGYEREPRIFLNKSKSKGNFIAINVTDKDTLANITNAKIEIIGKNKKWFAFSGNSSQSHFSNSDTLVRFGIGEEDKVDIIVKSLDGKIKVLKNQSVNRSLVVLL
jgi:hypothetical protein